jgi:hypothetical protein
MRTYLREIMIDRNKINCSNLINAYFIRKEGNNNIDECG